MMLFELKSGDHVWRLYEDGVIEGFPLGTVVINKAGPLLAKLRAPIPQDYDCPKCGAIQGLKYRISQDDFFCNKCQKQSSPADCFK